MGVSLNLIGLEREPEDPLLLSPLAHVYARVGREAEAIELIERAARLQSIDEDAIAGAAMLIDQATVYAALGRADDAVPILRRLLAVPADLSPASLRLEPRWDGIRDDPRFQQLAELPQP